MIGGDSDEGRAEQGVGSGGVNLNPTVAINEGKSHFRPRDLPIQLACIRRTLSGQRFERVQPAQQVVGEARNAHEPLGQLLLFYRCARTPAAALDDLLVGQDGLIYRVPVDLAFAAIDQVPVQQVEEPFLLLAVIGRFAGGEFARPVDRQTPAASARRACWRCCRTSSPWDGSCAPWRRFRPACRRRPNPWDGAR